MRDELRELFVSTYDLDLPPGDVDPTEPLFGTRSRFGLDSMDTLRFIALLNERYGLDIAATNTDSFRTIERIEAVLGPRQATTVREER